MNQVKCQKHTSGEGQNWRIPFLFSWLLYFHSYWKEYTSQKQQLLNFQEEQRSVDNQLKYAQMQLDRLRKTNVFNATFHIWLVWLLHYMEAKWMFVRIGENPKSNVPPSRWYQKWLLVFQAYPLLYPLITSLLWFWFCYNNCSFCSHAQAFVCIHVHVCVFVCLFEKHTCSFLACCFLRPVWGQCVLKVSSTCLNL